MTESHTAGRNVYFSLTRIALGFIFLWAFFDKLLGLGYATKSASAWLNGGSPTTGFLSKAVHGPFAGIYNGLAGMPLIDWLFMLGLLGIGVALVLGIGVRIAGYAGALLMFLMWSALLPPENNPIIDEHIIYMFLLLGFATSAQASPLVVSKWWADSSIVKQYPVLR
jgi:thiosulfate dehydrogenase (quinone) large subunit